jgi:hypothetical protein
MVTKEDQGYGICGVEQSLVFCGGVGKLEHGKLGMVFGRREWGQKGVSEVV